jgi:hypothetical protein
MTSWLTLWRQRDQETWHEAGQHPTVNDALKAARELRETGLQTTVCEWRNNDTWSQVK